MSNVNNTNEEYLTRIFAMCKKMERVIMFKEKTQLNTTELRLVGEIILAKHEGTRLISTQLAKRLGVTRSAISQIVNNLESRGIVKRIPDDVDRKIAYIELTESTMDVYMSAKAAAEVKVGEIIKEFGEENMEKLFILADKFGQAVENINEAK